MAKSIASTTLRVYPKTKPKLRRLAKHRQPFAEVIDELATQALKQLQHGKENR